MLYKGNGYTLVEIMIVIAIIGILSLSLFPFVSGYLERSKSTARKVKVDNVHKELLAKYPESGLFFANWTFDDTDYLYDKSGNGNNLTEYNSPIIETGNIGKTMKYNGVNQYLSTSIFNKIDLGNTDFSISLWMNTRYIAANQGLLLKGAGPFNAGGRGMELRRNMGALEFCIWGGVGVCPRIGTSIPVGGWKHIAITHIRSSGMTYLYIDGSEADSGVLLTTTYTDVYPLYIARGQDGYFEGYIDNVIFYSNYLEPSEILSLYRAGK